MNAKAAIKTTLTSTQQLLGWYLGDLSDADLLVRPVPAANHIAWQLGHVIIAEGRLLKEQIPAARFPELPAGFAEQHDKAMAAVEPPRGFATKATYVDLFTRTRAGTLAALESLEDAALDRPTQGQMAPFAPTLGDFFVLLSNHTLMHAGQFTVVRRKLGKPIVF
jgi:hypothetical protein